MEAIAVRCNHCGAGLDVDSNTRFVTCKFCQSQLEVKHTNSTTFTEVVQRIAENTDRMAVNLKVIELQNELERVDREWESTKEQFYTIGKDGRKTWPSKTGAIIAGVVGVPFAIFWIIAAISMNSFFVFAGVIFLVVIFFHVTTTVNSANQLQEAEVYYDTERSDLMKKIAAERSKRND